MFKGQPQTLYRQGDYSSVDNITAIAMHVAKNYIFMADTSGTIRRISLSGVRITKTILKGRSSQSNITQISQISVDWLNDHLYIVSQLKISRCDLNGENLEHLVEGFDKSPANVQVDPINGYLFYSLPKDGIYRHDLKKFAGQSTQHHNSVAILINDEGASAFTLDYEQNRILYPHVGKGGSIVITSVSENGTTRKDFRDEAKVTTSKFGIFKDIIFIDPTLYWTDGQKIFYELYESSKDRYFHNEFTLPHPDVVGIVVFENIMQPTPIPKLPVTNLTVVFSRSEAKVSWVKPFPLPFQGEGAWTNWSYELSVTARDGNETIVKGLKGNTAQIIDLIPNTEYWIKVRPYSDSGEGPWCSSVAGMTVEVSTPAPPPAPPTPEIKFDREKNMITWTKCPDSPGDMSCTYELAIRGVDEAQYTSVYNGSRVFWFVEKLPEGKDYFVKVRSRTPYAESNFSSDGVSFFYAPPTPYPTISSQQGNTDYIVAIITSSSVFFAAILAIFCFLGSGKFLLFLCFKQFC